MGMRWPEKQAYLTSALDEDFLNGLSHRERPGSHESNLCLVAFLVERSSTQPGKHENVLFRACQVHCWEVQTLSDPIC